MAKDCDDGQTYRESFRQPAFIVDHCPVIGAAVWLLQVGGAMAPNHQQAFREISTMFSANTIKAFANGFGNGGGQALLLAWQIA
jgi:hypothetical protein